MAPRGDAARTAAMETYFHDVAAALDGRALSTSGDYATTFCCAM